MIRFGFRRRRAFHLAEAVDVVRRNLAGRSIVMVGLMGCGKSSIGRRLAQEFGLPFVDADEEIEKAAGKSVPEIFKDHGEPYFRDGERRVIARLLTTGPHVIATGGGAFMNAETRANIARSGISVWLKADLDVLMRRVLRRDNRPLLKAGDPEAVMRRLMSERYPVYAEADLTVPSREAPHDTIVAEVVIALADHLSGKGAALQAGDDGAAAGPTKAAG